MSAARNKSPSGGVAIVGADVARCVLVRGVKQSGRRVITPAERPKALWGSDDAVLDSDGHRLRSGARSQLSSQVRTV